MNEKLDLKQLEQKAWRSIFQDGLYDIFLGVLIMHMGIVYLLSRSALDQVTRTSLNMGIYFFTVILLYLGKRYITVPRAGRVKFGKKRRSKLAWLTWVYFVGLILVMIGSLYVLNNEMNMLSKPLKQALSVSWLSIFFLLFFGVPAFILKYDRLYLIAVMFALPEPLSTLFKSLLGIELGFIAYALPAAVVLVMGIRVLIHFIKTYPVVKEPQGEEAHD